MKVLMFGASGMVGQGVLRECLAASDVTEVMVAGRAPISLTHAKLRHLVRSDLMNLEPVAAQLQGFDACFFCLGVSSAGMTEPLYTQLTHDLTLSIASLLVRVNPDMTFVYVSGAGTDGTEAGRSMWARVKGRTENDLRRLPFAGVCLFRPGIIQPLQGIRSKTRSYRIFYLLAGPMLSLARRVFPNQVLSTADVGEAMLNARRRRLSGVLESADIARLARD